MRHSEMKFYQKAALIFLAAVLEIPAFPPFSWYWFSFVFAFPLFIFLNKERRLIYILIGFFVYRILTGLGVAYFIFDPIMFFASASIFLWLMLEFNYENSRY